jgi:hypothetical protein
MDKRLHQPLAQDYPRTGNVSKVRMGIAKFKSLANPEG